MHVCAHHAQQPEDTYITMPTRSILTLLVHGVITNLKVWRETLNDIKM